MTLERRLLEKSSLVKLDLDRHSAPAVRFLPDVEECTISGLVLLIGASLHCSGMQPQMSVMRVSIPCHARIDFFAGECQGALQIDYDTLGREKRPPVIDDEESTNDTKSLPLNELHLLQEAGCPCAQSGTPGSAKLCVLSSAVRSLLCRE